MSFKLGTKLVQIRTLESTNNYAIELYRQNKLGNGSVVRCDFQSKGKGQRGNTWVSEDGKNLLCTIVYLPNELKVVNQFYISMAVSLGLVKYIQSETDKETSVKWPNDIYIENQKVAGILIENTVIQDVLKMSAIGIGLNINQREFSNELPNPTSLALATNFDYNVEQEFLNVLDFIEYYIEMLEKRQFDELKSAYLSNLYRFNEWSSFIKDGEEFKAKIVDVEEFGLLSLEFENGNTESFVFKEIEYII